MLDDGWTNGSNGLKTKETKKPSSSSFLKSGLICRSSESALLPGFSVGTLTAQSLSPSPGKQKKPKQTSDKNQRMGREGKVNKLLLQVDERGRGHMRKQQEADHMAYFWVQSWAVLLYLQGGREKVRRRERLQDDAMPEKHRPKSTCSHSQETKHHCHRFTPTRHTCSLPQLLNTGRPSSSNTCSSSNAHQRLQSAKHRCYVQEIDWSCVSRFLSSSFFCLRIINSSWLNDPDVSIDRTSARADRHVLRHRCNNDPLL